MKLTPVDTSLTLSIDLDQPMFISGKKIKARLALSGKDKMDMVTHQLKCHQTQRWRQGTGNSKQSHSNFHFLIRCKDVLHLSSVCIQMPEWSALLELPLTESFFLQECQHGVERNIVA